LTAAVEPLEKPADEVIRRTPWPTYDKGNVDIDHEDADAASRAVNSRRLFRYDTRELEETEVGRFEKEAADYFGVKYALATTSGTSAIALALLALGLGPGDEVLMSAFGFPATPSAILLSGATPVLVSLDENLHMDLDDLKAKIGRNGSHAGPDRRCPWCRAYLRGC
jgi:dTDP-4-amino-4,6-dideoxygalactose transaminase